MNTLYYPYYYYINLFNIKAAAAAARVFKGSYIKKMPFFGEK